MGWIYDLFVGNSKRINDLELDNADLSNQIETLKQAIKDILDNPQLEFPKEEGRITLNEERELLSTLTNNLRITDTYLSLTTKEQAQLFSVKTEVALKKFSPEAHDCDNFAAELYGYFNAGLWSYAFGMAQSPMHKFNIMIDNNKQIWIIEPQTNEFMTVDEAKVKSSPDGLSYFPIIFIEM